MQQEEPNKYVKELTQEKYNIYLAILHYDTADKVIECFETASVFFSCLK